MLHFTDSVIIALFLFLYEHVHLFSYPLCHASSSSLAVLMFYGKPLSTPSCLFCILSLFVQPGMIVCVRVCVRTRVYTQCGCVHAEYTHACTCHVNVYIHVHVLYVCLLCLHVPECVIFISLCVG